MCKTFYINNLHPRAEVGESEKKRKPQKTMIIRSENYVDDAVLEFFESLLEEKDLIMALRKAKRVAILIGE